MALAIRNGPSAPGPQSSSPSADLGLYLHEKQGVAYITAATEVLDGAAAAVRPTLDEHVEHPMPQNWWRML